MQSLPEEIIVYLSSFLGIYNFTLAQVSTLFRGIVKKEFTLSKFRDGLFREGDLTLLSHYSLPFTAKNIEEALERGHLPLLNYAYERKFEFPLNFFHRATLLAINRKELFILRWLDKRNLLSLTEEGFASAAKTGKIELLKFLHRRDCPYDETACASASNFTALTWLKRKGYPWNELTFANAGERGDIKLLSWLKRNKCPWDSWTFTNAVLMGRAKACKWLYRNKCPWSQLTSAAAAFKGRINFLIWLRRRGCPLGEKTFTFALKGRNKTVLLWLKENECVGEFSKYRALMDKS